MSYAFQNPFAEISKAPKYADLILPVFDFTGGMNQRASQLFLGQNDRFSMRSNQLVYCENLLRTVDGALITRPGRVKFNSTALAPGAGTTTVQDMVELIKSNGTSTFVVHAGNTIYKWTGSTFTSLGTLATSNTRIHWCQFQDVLVGFDGTNAPQRFDGTTLSNLAGTPPVASVACASHRNRVFAIAGRTLYFSALGNEGDWTTVNNAGSLPIPSTAGQGGTALMQFWDRLFIFADQNVFELTGTGPSDFAITAINFQYGHVGSPYGVVAAGNDVYFCSQRGVHSLGVTMARSVTGDVAAEYTSGKIEPVWQAVNTNNLSNIVGVHDAKHSLVIFLCNRFGTTNGEAMVADYYHLDESGTPIWPCVYSNFPFASACVVNKVDNTQELMFGGYDGFVYKQTDDVSDAGNVIPISAQFVTDLGVPGMSKTWRHILFYTQSSKGQLVVRTTFDYGDVILTDSVDMIRPVGDLIGSTFVVGKSVLGIGANSYKVTRISMPGSGRLTTIDLSASVLDRVKLGGWIIYGGLRRVVQT